MSEVVRSFVDRSKARPGPTLNIVRAEGIPCRGIAFDFPDERSEAVMTELKKREGGFTPNDLSG